MATTETQSAYLGRHPYWIDDLIFDSCGHFYRQGSGCRGTWILNHKGELTLNWEKWGSETLSPAGPYTFIGKWTTLCLWENYSPLTAFFKRKEACSLPIYLGKVKPCGFYALSIPEHNLYPPTPWRINSITGFMIDGYPYPMDPRSFYRLLFDITRRLNFEGELICKIQTQTKKGVASYRSFVSSQWSQYDLWCNNERLIYVLFQNTIKTYIPNITVTEESWSPYSSDVCLYVRGRKTQSSPDEYFVSPFFSWAERTGNKLFLIATAYAHAHRHGYECRIPWNNDQESKDLYALLKKSIPPDCLEGGYKQDIRYVEPCFSYREIPKQVSHGALRGYFQSSKHFSDKEDQIRTFFAPLVLSKKKHVAGIHLRLGDYLDYNHTFRIADCDYISQALSLLSPAIEELIIFSDSPIKAWNLLKGIPEARRFTVKIDGHNTLGALQELTSMEELIMSCSTFSWWGAWLGNTEKVIVQKEWFINRIGDYHDVYCDSWIKI